MRLLSCLVLASTVLLAACGDDSPTGGSGGAGGSGGSGGTPTEGGGGAGGAPVEGASLGEPCLLNEDCAGGLCLTEDYFGWAAGYCSALCEPELFPCDEGACVFAPSGSNVCLKTCNTPADCQTPGSDCQDIGQLTDPLLVCIGGCDDDAQCEHACDADNAVCVAAAEVCDNGADDDGDGYHDCVEADCLTDAGCVAAIDDTCSSAVAITDGVPVDDTTETGTDLFAAVCGSVIGDFPTGLAHEHVYNYTASGKGEVTFTAHAIEGDLALYVRSTCDSPASQLECADRQVEDDTDEFVTLQVTAGQELVVYVDAYSLIGEGDFELVATFQPEVCGDGVIIGAEQCDDNNTTSGDGCSATCVVEPAALCASLAVTDVLLSVPAAGDTSLGTSGFVGSCAGDGGELIFKYTPLVPDNVRVTIVHDDATPTHDSVLYTRSACADEGTEILCRDDGIAGDDETMLLPVTVGEPIFIFVDSYASDNEGPFTLTVEPM